MKRARAKLVLPALGVVGFVLAYSGLIDARDAVFIAVATLIVFFGMAAIFFAVKRFRRSRSEGLEGWDAFESGLSAMTPEKVARVAVLETRLLVSLGRWMLRRTKPREGEFPYHESSKIKPFAILFILASPADLLIVHILAHAFSPWAWVKWALLVVGIYCVFWIAALYASLPANPHRLEKNGVRLRYGVHVGAFVPYSEIREVERVRRESPEGRDGLGHEPDGGETHIAVGGKTDLTLRLETPIKIRGFLKKTDSAKTIRFAANDPKEMEGELRRRVEAEASTGERIGHPRLTPTVSGRAG